jgi:hypothetical protein
MIGILNSKKITFISYILIIIYTAFLLVHFVWFMPMLLILVILKATGLKNI